MGRDPTWGGTHVGRDPTWEEPTWERPTWERLHLGETPMCGGTHLGRDPTWREPTWGGTPSGRDPHMGRDPPRETPTWGGTHLGETPPGEGPHLGRDPPGAEVAQPCVPLRSRWLALGGGTCSAASRALWAGFQANLSPASRTHQGKASHSNKGRSVPRAHTHGISSLRLQGLCLSRTKSRGGLQKVLETVMPLGVESRP